MATSKVNTWECVIPLDDEVLPEPSPGFTSTKHGDHDQSEHGNWATGETRGTGTKDDPIRTSDVEAAARAVRGVHDVAAVARQDAEWGRVPVVLVVGDADPDAVLAAIADHAGRTRAEVRRVR